MAIPVRTRLRARRKKHVQKQLRRCERTLLVVYRSGRHIYAQLADPLSGKTITGTSTRSPTVRDGLESTKDMDAAKRVGTAIAALARERNIEEVAFHRNGFVFTGRIKALADAAREGGLRF